MRFFYWCPFARQFFSGVLQQLFKTPLQFGTAINDKCAAFRLFLSSLDELAFRKTLGIHSKAGTHPKRTTTENHYRLGGRASGTAADAGAGAAAGPSTAADGPGYHPGGVGLP